MNVSDCGSLKTIPCHKKRVILRADLNVPLTKTRKSTVTIEDDFRLQEIRPSLDFLLNKEATIILITHLGRPSEHEPAFSTALIVTWLCKHGYHATLASTLHAAHELSQKHPGTIIVLENIRTFPGETNNDATFAKELANLGDCYVNDAFGTLHRNDTSITLVPRFFSPEKRCIGLLVEHELAMLKPLIQNPQKPFMLVIGGGKVADKLPLIEHWLGRADTILICPVIAFTFMRAQGMNTGASLVDTALIDTCKNIITRAAAKKTKLLLPTDLVVAHKTPQGPLSTKSVTDLAPDDIGVTLGSASLTRYKEELSHAKTIFFNAAMGFLWQPETLTATKDLIEALGSLSAYSVIGGGDSVAIARTCQRGKGIRHLSTGGGATLAYLSGEKLPGLEAVCHR